MLVFVPRDGALLGERLVALIARVDGRRRRPSRHLRRIGIRSSDHHGTPLVVRVTATALQVLDDLGQRQGSVGQRHLRGRDRFGRQQRLRAERYL